jgi:hypothetical protein
MNIKELETLYGLWGGDVWPQNPVMARLKQISDHFGSDTRLRTWDTVVSGGDIVTRVFALRALSRQSPKGRVLYIPASLPRELIVPWMFSSDLQKKINEEFFGGEGDLISNLEEVMRESISRLLISSSSFKRTTRLMSLKPGEFGGPHLMVLNKMKVSVNDEIKKWSFPEPRLTSAYKSIPLLDEKPGLIGGRVNNLWYLSGKSQEKSKRILNFSFSVSSNQPILETQTMWHQNLRCLWRLNEEKDKK